ncbi:MAG: hypothetical protein NC408_09675 [Candidatus Gastranaerophilales bacterium]|nr:hypothetical protein [Candidatus Gastranaerophilales bacterium]MCM1073780.1 hypothetical protein [Bacteroides sp.]
MLKFDLARNALRYIVKRDGIKEIYIPYYLCDVIRHTLFEENCKTLFYHIDDNFMPDKEFPRDSYILYPNYFGICSNNVEKLINLYPHLIVDNAHAFYAQPSGYASFNSSRKFLPENEGAFLWFREGINPAKPNLKRQEEFFRLHKEFKEHNLLKIDIKQNDIPFCYPLLANTQEEADNIAKNLQKEGKIIYRYWNNLPKSFNEYKFYSRLVPIPL